MSGKKITILALHIHSDKGIEIEMLEDGLDLVDTFTLVGVLEKIKFDLLRANDLKNKVTSNTNYDA